MVNQEDGQMKLALKLAKEGKQRGDLSGVIFIDSMEADQGIEDEQNGLDVLHGVG